MLGSEVLDVAIGLIFVFVLVSIICSAIREGLEAWMKTRAIYLERGIRELLQDPGATGLAKQLFEHPLVSGLYAGTYTGAPASSWWPWAMTRGRSLPSYIPSRNFALALMDMAARGPAVDHVSSLPETGAISFDTVRANVATIDSPPIQRVLLTALDTAQGDLQQAQANIEAWYDSAMDRVSGWYKRSTQWTLFGIGLLVAIAMNINTVAIAEHLYRDKTVRDALVKRAEAAATIPGSQGLEYVATNQEIAALSLPVGWSRGWVPPLTGEGKRPTDIWNQWGILFIGWLLTALAASFGAPFWFDLLNKIMVIRSTVKPHEKSQEEGSEDRPAQPATAAPARALLVPPTVGPAVAPTTPAPLPMAFAGGAASAALHPDHVDGCDVEIDDVTRDEDLPAAEGGVA